MPYKPEDKDEAAKLRRGLGKRIRAARMSLGWSQESLAEEVGVGSEMLGRYERGVKFPSHVTLVRLSGVLGLSTDQLLGIGAAAEKRAAARNDLYQVLDGLSSIQRNAVVHAIRELISPYGEKGR